MNLAACQSYDSATLKYISLALVIHGYTPKVDKLKNMSGPVEYSDASFAVEPVHEERGPAFDIFPSRNTTVGQTLVRRALPKRQLRTIGKWCFADHFGPIELPPGKATMEVGPHPHIGIRTVTWLLEGEIVHRDSLGYEQLITPGQLNLMTAGFGVAHSEESPSEAVQKLHGIQLWVAQPDSTRNGEPSFEHHAGLPQTNFDNATATVLVGNYGNATSPASTDGKIVGAEISFAIGESTLELQSGFEYGVIVLEGKITVGTKAIPPGMLLYLGQGRNYLPVYAPQPSTIMLLGGEPFEEPILMWWNFAARTQSEMTEAYQKWQTNDARFGKVGSRLPKIEAPKPYWL